MNALNTQIGGSHYKDLAMQPIELIARIRCSFIQGCIIKYIARYKHKNGAQDIKKALHYALLAKQLGDKRRCKDSELSVGIAEFSRKNNLSKEQTDIITRACHDRYDIAADLCNKLLAKEYPQANMREFKL